eukprot:157444_1
MDRSFLNMLTKHKPKFPLKVSDNFQFYTTTNPISITHWPLCCQRSFERYQNTRDEPSKELKNVIKMYCIPSLVPDFRPCEKTAKIFKHREPLQRRRIHSLLSTISNQNYKIHFFSDLPNKLSKLTHEVLVRILISAGCQDMLWHIVKNCGTIKQITKHKKK